MGRRREQRTFILLPVTVRGTDSRGKPFEVAAETCDISDFGARLRGLSSLVSLGGKIEVECKEQKAWYAIQWIGQPRTRSAKQVGIRLLEPGKYIWGICPKEWAPDTFDTSQPSDGDRIGSGGNDFENPRTLEERRRFLRTPYRVETRVTSEGSHATLTGTVTDISLGGCYVETIGPPPMDTVVGLDLKTGDTSLHLFGTIRFSQPGFGMGIEFTKMSSEDFEKLQSLVPISPDPSEAREPPSQRTIQQPRAAASLREISSLPEPKRNRPTTAESLDAVMRLLFRKGLVTRAEVAEEVESLKTAKAKSLP